MIAIKLQGRLGNQLFQYAFIYNLAKKNGLNFYLDVGNEDFLLPEYFQVQKNKFAFLDEKIFKIYFYKGFFRYFLRKKFYTFAKKFYGLKVQGEIFDIENQHYCDKHIISGFFQSEKYFLEIKSEIIALFQIKTKFKTKFLEIKSKLPNYISATVVHLRLTDYINTNFFTPIEYFHKTIKKYSPKENFIIFISDDPEFVEREFNYIPYKFVSKNEEIVDFQFLLQADVCIIPNSTFSWWGAYLNPKINKKIICPKYWSGQKERVEEPKDIIPNQWIQIEI